MFPSQNASGLKQMGWFAHLFLFVSWQYLCVQVISPSSRKLSQPPRPSHTWCSGRQNWKININSINKNRSSYICLRVCYHTTYYNLVNEFALIYFTPTHTVPPPVQQQYSPRKLKSARAVLANVIINISCHIFPKYSQVMAKRRMEPKNRYI